MILKLKRSELPFKIPFQCRYCGEWDIVHRSQLNHYAGAGKFCSRQCIYSYWRLYPEKRSDFKNGKTIDGNGYVMVKDPNRGPNQKVIKIREHRLVMEKYLKRSLESWEHIHHKNGDRTDNRIENLILMDEANHHLLHSNGNAIWGKPARWLEWDFSTEPESWQNPMEIILDPFVELDIVDFYLDGLGMARIGKLFGYSGELVKRVLRDYQIPFRKPGRHKMNWSTERYEALKARANKLRLS